MIDSANLALGTYLFGLRVKGMPMHIACVLNVTIVPNAARKNGASELKTFHAFYRAFVAEMLDNLISVAADAVERFDTLYGDGSDEVDFDDEQALKLLVDLREILRRVRGEKDETQ